MRITLIGAIHSRLYHNQFLRYLAVGSFNTFVGYGIYAALNYLLTDLFPYSYMAAAVLSNITAITIAYINYKFFVFKTRGNYLREYLRCYAVYGLSFLIGIILLPVFVEGFGIDSYIAGALLLPIGVLISFLGHKNYSFRSLSPRKEGFKDLWI